MKKGHELDTQRRTAVLETVKSWDQHANLGRKATREAMSVALVLPEAPSISQADKLFELVGDRHGKSMRRQLRGGTAQALKAARPDHSYTVGDLIAEQGVEAVFAASEYIRSGDMIYPASHDADKAGSLETPSVVGDEVLVRTATLARYHECTTLEEVSQLVGSFAEEEHLSRYDGFNQLYSNMQEAVATEQQAAQ